MRKIASLHYSYFSDLSIYNSIESICNFAESKEFATIYLENNI